MRYEGKHEEFKQMFRRSKNKINVAKSLAVKHQMHQALLHERPNYLKGGQYSYAGLKTIFTILLPRAVRELLQHEDYVQDTISEADKVEQLGTHYPKGCAVILACDDSDERYVFGRISHIFIIGSIPILCCEILQHIDYDSHLHAYLTEGSNQFVFVPLTEIYDCCPLGIYERNENVQAVVLKYHVS